MSRPRRPTPPAHGQAPTTSTERLVERMLAQLRAFGTRRADKGAPSHLAQKIGTERLGFCSVYAESELCRDWTALIAEADAWLAEQPKRPRIVQAPLLEDVAV